MRSTPPEPTEAMSAVGTQVPVPTTSAARRATRSVPTATLGGFVVAALKIRRASPIIRDDYIWR